MPFGLIGIVTRHWHPGRRHESNKGDRDRVPPGVPAWITVSAKLGQSLRPESGLFQKLPSSRKLQRLHLIDEPAGQRPLPTKRLPSPPDQKQLESIREFSKENDVNGDAGPRFGVLIETIVWAHARIIISGGGI